MVSNPRQPSGGTGYRENKASERAVDTGAFPHVTQAANVDAGIGHKFAHDGQDTSGYRGVSEDYKTYATTNDKPLASAGFTAEGEGSEAPKKAAAKKAAARKSDQ